MNYNPTAAANPGSRKRFRFVLFARNIGKIKLDVDGGKEFNEKVAQGNFLVSKPIYKVFLSLSLFFFRLQSVYMCVCVVS